MNTTRPRPTNLRMDGPDLVIEWSDGTVLRYPPARLRALCPCATCSESRSEATDDTTPQRFSGVTFRNLTPVGNYAYQIAFSDGHDTGIYTLDYLYRLGDFGQE
ncbi:MAG: gamma-butyrobetaine hydroxylase-like domain-containing protein [Thermogutta sp.]